MYIHIIPLQNTQSRVIPQYIGTKSRNGARNRLRALQMYHGNGTIAGDVIAIKFNRFVQRETKTDWRNRTLRSGARLAIPLTATG